MALAFVAAHDEYRYVASWHRWLEWDGKRWREDSARRVLECIRVLVREVASGRTASRASLNALFIAGVEKMLRSDPHLVLTPDQLDADPWTLNTQSGLVDLRTGAVRAHDPAAFCTRITSAAFDPDQGASLWAGFLDDITRGDAELRDYLQRVAGYCATGVVSEDVLIYIFGIGSNGKGSFAEALIHALGDYGRVFSPETLMEARGERHPTELAQFEGVRLALTSEPGSAAAWNDSRIKSLTGDTVISARFMRGDFFTFTRTHKTLVIGNHLPTMATVTHAIRRRFHAVPFRAVFKPKQGEAMRERLKQEAGGAALAWIIEGARRWIEWGTSPPQAVRELTDEYLSEQDTFGQWLEERCDRSGFELLAELHRDYRSWCEQHGARAPTDKVLSQMLRSAGFSGRKTMVGKVFDGLSLRAT